MHRSFNPTVPSSFTYAKAVAALNALQPNASIVHQLRMGKLSNSDSLPETIEWLKKLGYAPKDFDSFDAIHVAGTKGKGSTCAFVASILAQYLHDRGSSIGMYTSPHMRHIRERIQIDGKPLSEEQFATCFSHVWSHLAGGGGGDDDGDKATLNSNSFFRILTIMALHAFKQARVRPAIIECGIGGAFDTTNVLEAKRVTAVTTLGRDHVRLLGDSHASIAWHKGGIFTSGAVAITVPQQSTEALHMLQHRASERNAQLHVIARPLPQIESGEVRLGMQGEFQKINASLAAVIASVWLVGQDRVDGNQDDIPDLLAHPHAPLPPKFVAGLAQAKLPGRCDVRADWQVPRLSWYLDGAHTVESVRLATQWFAKGSTAAGSTSTRRVLIFNQQDRDAPELARELFSAFTAVNASGSRPFEKVIFTTNITTTAKGYTPELASLNANANGQAAGQDPRVQRQLADYWPSLESGCYTKADVEISPSIEAAIAKARQYATHQPSLDQCHVFVVGSLHLVGGAIEVLEQSL